MPDLTDDEIRLIRLWATNYGAIARANARDEYLSEAERAHYAGCHRTCLGLLPKLKTVEERLREDRSIVGLHTIPTTGLGQ